MIEPITFIYTDIGNSNIGARMLPLLPVSLINGNNRLEANGLLDSGAVVSVLPYSAGIQLGLLWEDHRIYFQLAGNLDRIPAKAVLLSVQVANMEPVTIAFAWSQSDSVRLILGQTNFFTEFDVCFFRSKETFEIRPNP